MTRARTWIAYSLALVVGAAVVAFDQVVPPAPAPPPPTAPAAVSAPVGGSFVCVVGSDFEATQGRVTVARPDSTGAAPSSVEASTLEDGGLESTALPPVFPTTHGRVDALGGEAAATVVRWSGPPVAVSRQWRWAGADQLPPGTVAGPCPRSSGETWMVPGMSTVGGEEARLRIANPYRSDATIAVGFRTPEGVQEPIALSNLTVEARSVREIVVNELLPERADLAALVEVGSGRVAVEGYQIARSAIGGVDGASLLAASDEPAETWTIPWVVDGERRASWLWVLNPSDRTATVEVSLHTGAGGGVPDGLTEVTVPPGGLRRVDLRGTFAPDDEPAVTVRSNGVPVVASAGVRVGGDEVAATGFAVELGSSVSSGSWVVSGGATAGRDESLRVVNPSGSGASYSVALFDGVTVRRPEELQELVVGPGALDEIALTDHLGAVDGWSAFVTTSSGEVVVGRVGTGGEDALHLVATAGTPASAWRAPVDPLPDRQHPDLLQRFGTDLGIDVEDPLLTESPSPDVPETARDAS